MIKPTKLFILGCFVIISEGIVFGVMMDNILKGFLIGIGGVIIFTILDLISIYAENGSLFIVKGKSQ